MNPSNPMMARLIAARSGLATEKFFKGMIIGEKGVGKTYILKTCRKPVLHICFDPSGETTLLDKQGNVPDWLLPVTEFQGNTAEDFRRFVKFMDDFVKSGIVEHIGTVCLDSLTTWGESLLAMVLEEARKQPKHGERMEIQDWGDYLSKTVYYIKKMVLLPCDVVLLGHIQQDQDAITGRIINNLMYSGSSSQRAPIIMSEVYYLQTRDPNPPKPGAPPERFLITGNDGKFKASTRLGRDGLLNLHESADINAIKRKAGIYKPDLPSITATKAE